jgi:hypothetical protein
MKILSVKFSAEIEFCKNGPRSIGSFAVVVGEHDYHVKGDGEQHVHVEAIIQEPIQ